jgi:N-acetylglucosamine kinase (EC 2.7.1.59)
MSQPLWGIDLGGTKIEGVILPSLNNPQPILRTRIDTEGHKGYQHIVSQINKLVGIMKEQSGLTPTRIGFGTPGVLDPMLQTMKNCNSTALNGQPLQKDLEKYYSYRWCWPMMPIVCPGRNALGYCKRKMPGARMVFGIIMGTGVGGGIVVDGQVWNGGHGIAGEWGHNHLDDSGGPCYCGKTGCVEKVISGPALQEFYKSLTGANKTLKEIIALKARGDEAAAKTIDRLCHFFGKAVSVVINILDPDVIVVGGGVGNVDDIYSKGVESIRRFIFNNRVDVPVLKPSLGDSAGVFGAAALVA